MTQTEALKLMKNIITYSKGLKRSDVWSVEAWRLDDLMNTLNHMIEVKSKPKTPEQREQENERRRAARAEKRAKRDAEILDIIKPYMDKPRTAYELQELTQWRVKAGEVTSFFNRRGAAIKAEFYAPRTACAYQIRD